MKGYFRKRGNKWSFTCDIGIDETGRRKQKTFSGYKTKKEAELVCSEILKQINEQAFLEPSKACLKEYLEDWLTSSAKATWRNTTYETNLIIIHRHIYPSLGRIKLAKLTPLHLQKFYARKLDSGLSAEYVRKMHAILSVALKQAVQWNILSKNPAELTQPPKLTYKEKSTWTIQEVHRFLTYSQNEPLQIAYRLAIYTGMRLGEILGLRWKDCDFEKGRIHITQTLTRANQKLGFQEPKTKGSRRTITITIDVIEALHKHKRMQNQNKLRLGPAYQDHGLIVCTGLGTPINPSNVRRHYNRMIQESGVPKIRFHDMRHSHATIMLQLGEHPKVVSERLGHSRISITMDTYSHVLPSMQENAAKKFSEALQTAE